MNQCTRFRSLLKLLGLLTACCWMTSGFAQMDNRWFGEVGLYRYAQESGVNYAYWGRSNDPSYIQSFALGFIHNERLRYSIGLRRLNTRTRNVPGYVNEDYIINGAEVRTSVDFTCFTIGRLSIRTGLDLFGEFSTIKGGIEYDHPGYTYVHHKKRVLGFAPRLVCSVRILERLSLFAETRYRIGKMRLSHFGDRIKNVQYFPNLDDWDRQFDPLQAVGLTFLFY